VTGWIKCFCWVFVLVLRLWELTGGLFDGVDFSLVFLPIGSIERHGYHLTLGTDTFTSLYIAERVAEEVGGVVLPPIWYGSCQAMKSHPGTFDVSQETLSKLVEEVLKEAWRNGAKLAIVINGHGGNTQILHYTARKVAGEIGLAITVIDWWRDVALEKRRELFKNPGHAGEDETSAMLAIKPELVDLSKAVDVDAEYPPFKLYHLESEEKIYRKAVTGHATQADPKKGMEWLNTVISEIVEIVNSLRSYLEANK
jgi:creatinine amidohydrolase